MRATSLQLLLACGFALTLSAVAAGRASGQDNKPASSTNGTPAGITFGPAASCYDKQIDIDPTFDTPNPRTDVLLEPPAAVHPLPTSVHFTGVDSLIKDWETGADRWHDLQEELQTILLHYCNFPYDKTNGKSAKLEFAAADATVFTIVGSDKKQDSVVVPEELPYGSNLPGVRTVNVVIFVERDTQKPSDDFILMSTRTANPAEASVASFVKTILTGVTGTFKLPTISGFSVGGEIKPVMYAYASQVTLPFRRASVVETGTIKEEGKNDVAVKAAYTNTPKTRVELTAIAGAIVGPVSGPGKMKVDSGKYASDPLSRAMTMAAVSVHVPFDGTLADMSWQERWSWFVGGVLTPGVGIGTGVSVAVIRGLAVNAGVVCIWIPTARSGSGVGSAATGNPQLVYRSNIGGVLGMGYVFKGS